MGADTVKLGVVASLNRPGGNVTGMYQYYGALGGKRLELIRELVPSLAVLAVLSNPNNPNAEDHLNDIRSAASVSGQQVDVFRASNEEGIDAAFAELSRRRANALLVADDPLFGLHREGIVALAARYAVPASYYAREFALAGGLIRRIRNSEVYRHGYNAVANRTDVRYWHKADITTVLNHVRYWGKADIGRTQRCYLGDRFVARLARRVPFFDRDQIQSSGAEPIMRGVRSSTVGDQGRI